MLIKQMIVLFKSISCFMAIRRKHYKSYGLLVSTHYQKFKTSVILYLRLFKMATYTMARDLIFL